MRILFLALAVMAASAARAESVPVPPKIQKIIEQGDGLGPSTAFKVSSVKDEYVILEAMGLKPESQALVIVGKRPFDQFKATNAEGEAREVWFDISKFYMRF